MLNDIERKGISNDSVSSFRIETGLIAVFYTDNNFLGSKLVIDSTESFYTPNLACFNLALNQQKDLSFNDRLSSLKLYSAKTEFAVG